MDANENNLNRVSEEVIELGVASIETHGPVGNGETNGTPVLPGISSE